MPAYKDEVSVRGSWFYALLQRLFPSQEEVLELHEYQHGVPPVQRAPPPEEVQDAR